GLPRSEGKKFTFTQLPLVATPRHVTFAAQPSLVPPISHIAPFQTGKPQEQGILHRAILPRNVTAAGHASQGSSVFQGRGVGSEGTPVMHSACQDRVFTSRAQPSEARDGSVSSPSQKTTTAGQDAMTAGPKAMTAGHHVRTSRAIHHLSREHKEEVLNDLRIKTEK
ncbi:hypothetical protein E4U61_005995, partial [Claviceps capensis]